MVIVMQEKNGEFEDFDSENTYNKSAERAQRKQTYNFVVEFGKDEAQVAFDLGGGQFERLVSTPPPKERPVRWINIWAPHKQTGLLELLGKNYDLSPRLLAIMHTPPLSEPPPRVFSKKHRFTRHPKDEESANLPTTRRAFDSAESLSHYGLANRMWNYQSFDVGTHYLCVGANWMHGKPSLAGETNIEDEGKQRRLWSWLILCHDHTVISLHEHPEEIEDGVDLRSMRGNTLSVLSQLSNLGHVSVDPMSMQQVRKMLKDDASQTRPGIDGASLLFYYLFDDWRAVFSTVTRYSNRLENLRKEILGDISRRSDKTAEIDIIPRLHVLGSRTRQMQHVYEGYRNLIQRILEPNATKPHGVTTHPPNLKSHPSDLRSVELARSARQRFERLGDRIDLLILSETRELLAEKEALVSTYFNINAQKDSEATARLTRSATLLAKLSVLFLPVSLMTSYFSIQVADLDGVYTVKDYWYSFAVLMSVSFLFLFFFSRLLMWVTETLDAWVKKINMAAARFLLARLRKKKSSRESSDN